MEVAVRDITFKPGSFEEFVKGLKEVGIRSFELLIEKDMTTCWKESLKGEKAQKNFAKKLKDMRIKCHIALY